MAAQWFYRRAGAEHGPVSSGKIRRMVERGELAPTDLLWKLGMEEWRPAGESATLFGRDEARAADPRRDPAGGPKRRPRGGRAPASLTAAAAWTGRRPLLTSIGIGAGAGVVISAILATLILVFSRSPFEELDAAAEAVVAPPPRPVAAQPAKPQPAAVKPAAADVAAAQPAAAEALAAVTAPIAPDRPRADPPAELPADAPQPESPDDMQAESSRQPRPRIRVLLPGEDF